MSRATVAWKITGGTPAAIPSAAIPTERDLEDWIEKKPSLIDAGLVILARQLETESGPLDLLALDKAGALVVIELKRAKAYRETAGQVLDYAAWLAEQNYETLRAEVNANRTAHRYDGTLEGVLVSHLGQTRAAKWTPEDPGVRCIVAGTGGDESLRRIISYLSERYDVPINGIFFDFYEGNVLVRTSVLSDEEELAVARRKGRGGTTDEQVRELAESNHTDAIVAPVLANWEKFTTRTPRPEKQSWTLGAAQKGTKTVARLYPWSDDHPEGVAWLQLKLGALAEDTDKDSAAVTKEWADAGLALQEGDWVELPSVDAANKAVEVFGKLYDYGEEAEQPVRPAVVNGAGGPRPEQNETGGDA